MSADGHIVLVEDNEATRYAVSRVLRGAGYRVTSAGDGHTGIATVHATNPELVLLDVNLPDMSGWEVVRRLKSDPGTAAIPVVHLSATHVSPAAQVRGLEGGADAFLTHPVDPHVLVATVNAFLRARRAEARYRRVFETGLLGVVHWNRDGIVLDANDTFLRLVGFDRDDVAAGRLRWDAIAGAPASVPPSADGAPSELVLTCRDGGTVPVLLGRTPDDGGREVTAFVLDISDRKRSEAALRNANEQLLEADRRKDEFLGMLSHELRNPLAPIRNSVYVLRNSPAGSEQARRAEDVIERQTGHLTRLVDDLLDVTRIARGKIELRRSRVDLREVVLRAADDFRLLLEERGVTFRTALPDAKIWVDADATRIAQVIGNLLQNGAKFTRVGDQVTLSARAAGAEAEIAVRDTGAGIAAALLPHVFEPFVQGDRTLARSEGGLGLGLALVKGIAELHGGTVRAQSAGAGNGAEFVVRLPLAGPPAGEVRQHGGTQQARARRRVLVVDDNRDAAESLAQIVALLGHPVAVAFDGPGAIAMARANPPDVVLCDLGLPEMSGYEVARVLREDGRSDLQLVAVSGYAQPEDLKAAAGAGFDRHVAKPPDPAEIAQLLA